LVGGRRKVNPCRIIGWEARASGFGSLTTTRKKNSYRKGASSEEKSISITLGKKVVVWPKGMNTITIRWKKGGQKDFGIRDNEKKKKPLRTKENPGREGGGGNRPLGGRVGLLQPMAYRGSGMVPRKEALIGTHPPVGAKVKK